MIVHASLEKPSRRSVANQKAGIHNKPLPTVQQLARPSAYVLAAKEDQKDACEDEMNALFEFLTTEPAICLTA